jgi:uncharacterized FlaG/YvyC family protein
MNISSTHTPAPVPFDSNPLGSNPLGSNKASAEPSSSRPLPQDQSTLIRAVQSLNDSEMFGQENELTFAIDRAARVVVVRLVNKNTRELVEQIPDGFVLRLAEELNTEHAK